MEVIGGFVKRKRGLVILQKWVMMQRPIWAGAAAEVDEPDDDNELTGRQGCAGSQDFGSYLSLIRQCGISKDLAEGKRVHADIVKVGLEHNRVLGNLLVEMYGKCGSVRDATWAFGSIHEPNVFSWTILIAAYAHNGYCRQALQILCQMQLEGLKPNTVTFNSVLSGCANQGTLTEGKTLHGHLVESGFKLDITLENTLINMYAKCGCLDDARSIFDKMERKNAVSWTSMITAYARHDQGKEALELYWRMSLQGVRPDEVTFISVLDACACVGALSQGKAIHSFVAACGYDSHVVVATALVNLYGKCGTLEDTRNVFEKMKFKNAVSWNAMITACAQHEHGKEALQLFKKMELEGLKAYEITYVSVLSACSCLGALAKGKAIHARVIASGFDSNIVLGNTIVNMYGKCGSLDEATSLFEQMSGKNVVSWNAIIAAYAHNGHGEVALQIYKRMDVEGTTPNEITFINVLVACSHSGMLARARTFFLSMVSDYSITPLVWHYKCMVDLFGRSGRLDQAEDLMNNMPFEPDSVPWVTLLGACKTHGDVERGSRFAEQLILQLDLSNASPYVLLSNMCAEAGKWDLVAKIRRLMDSRGVKKIPGCSWIEIGNAVHEFVVGDTSHPQAERIFTELKNLHRQMKEAGYVPDTKAVLHDLEEEEKEHALFFHSEKLAIALGIIRTLPGTSLRIVKNLRVCSDCHAATKFISRIVEREIIVRDAVRFHRFKHGVCSCGDYW